MRIVWASSAWDDYVAWQSSDPGMADKINQLIGDIRRNPFVGLGKPEPLKMDMAGWWARRIDKEHRLVYRVSGRRGADQQVDIAKCRFHYR